jgi:hypothetical protein
MPVYCFYQNRAYINLMIMFCEIVVFKWLEPTMYRTPGEHAHHYTTDAVSHVCDTEYICVILSI